MECSLRGKEKGQGQGRAVGLGALGPRADTVYRWVLDGEPERGRKAPSQVWSETPQVWSETERL